MDIKKSIRALLQTKFGGAQLSNARVDALAKRLEGKAATEEELEAKLVSLDELHPFAEIASEDDRARTVQAELDKAKGKPDPIPTPPVPTPPAPEPTDTNKLMLEALKVLTDSVTSLKGEKALNDRKSSILAKLKTADETYSDKVLRDFGRMTFSTEEDFTAYLADIETDYATHVQTAAESQLGKDAPFVATGADGRVKQATKDELDAVMGEIGFTN